MERVQPRASRAVNAEATWRLSILTDVRTIRVVARRLERSLTTDLSPGYGGSIPNGLLRVVAYGLFSKDLPEFQLADRSSIVDA